MLSLNQPLFHKGMRTMNRCTTLESLRTMFLTAMGLLGYPLLRARWQVMMVWGRFNPMVSPMEPVGQAQQYRCRGTDAKWLLQI
ncbi:MAG: hypothetical protein EBT30_06015 [Verrucomicrobia bacterium]|nr:hypothetical protein [Verrucomicrobiota bacterium]